MKIVYDFFTQKSDDVGLVEPCYPIEPYDPTTPIYSVPELVVRGVGVALSITGVLVGLAMVFGDRKK